jgi:hypothetical protein
MQKLFIFVLISYSIFFSCCRYNEFEVPDTAGMKWYKGNTHAHSLVSDGDSSPDSVANWYRKRNYQFLVLTDHNILTDSLLTARFQDSTFILIRGEEVSVSNKEVLDDTLKKPIHVNALHINHTIIPQYDTTFVGTIQKNVDEIRKDYGTPQICHPNYRWSFTHQIINHVENVKLFEIFNGHPKVNNFGGGDSPGTEQMWDALLTSGKRIFGIACDDAHGFQGEFSSKRSNPGRGWIVVRASELDAAEIVQNLDRGLFYASTGVELDDLIITPREIEIKIRQLGDAKYRTEFIGNRGRVLNISIKNPAIFHLSHKEKYIRAKVYSSNGSIAWIQPVFLK